MYRPTRCLLALALAVLPASGCGGEPSADEAPAVEAAPAAAPASPSPTADRAMLRVDTLAGLGAYLTDGEGRALYLLEGEPTGESTCYDACAEEWPPFLAARGGPTAGAPPVQAGLTGTVRRRDGSVQVTYDGHALYYYHDDQGRGRTEGQDLTDEWGEWYLVRPEGGPLEEHGEEGRS